MADSTSKCCEIMKPYNFTQHRVLKTDKRIVSYFCELNMYKNQDKAN